MNKFKPLNLEDVFSSKTTLKILLALKDEPKLTPTKISRKTGTGFYYLKDKLEKLNEQGLIEIEEWGPIKYIKPNLENPYLKLIFELFDKWGALQ